MRLQDAATYMLVTDHGREPDWGAAIELVRGLDRFDDEEDLFEATAPEHGAEHGAETPGAIRRAAARDELIAAAKDLASEWELAADDKEGSSIVWEIRQVRDADVHILYDYWDDPCGLWPKAEMLATHVPGFFATAGFDR